MEQTLIEALLEDAEYIDNYDCFVGSADRIVNNLKAAALRIEDLEIIIWGLTELSND